MEAEGRVEEGRDEGEHEGERGREREGWQAGGASVVESSEGSEAVR